MTETPILPTDAAARKQHPVFSGCLKYFPETLRAIAMVNNRGLFEGLILRYPRALAAISHLSWVGNEQHNPGQHLHWDKSKSADEPDALIRHLIEDERVHVAWRACANCERLMGAGPVMSPKWECPPAHYDGMVSELLSGSPIYAAKIALEMLEISLKDGWEHRIALPERKVSETIQEAVVSSDKPNITDTGKWVVGTADCAADKPDRDCAVGEGDCDYLVPAGLPPLPEGWVYFGKGPLKVPAGKMDRQNIMCHKPAISLWFLGSCGTDPDLHYALRKGSCVAKSHGFA